jgi:hypothetical protein
VEEFMARRKRQYRVLTVNEVVGYSKKPAPFLRIKGLWLKDYGFNVRDPYYVKCEEGKLIITLGDEIKEAMLEERKRLKL